jgi:hypothetical protein
MKLSEFNKRADEYTAKASEITRQLILGGLAIIWLFKVSIDGTETLDRFLLVPLICLSIALVADLLQYVWGGKIWKAFFLQEETKAKANHNSDSSKELDPDIKAPKKLSKPIYFFYWTKILLMLLSYLLLIVYLINKVTLQ